MLSGPTVPPLVASATKPQSSEPTVARHGRADLEAGVAVGGDLVDNERDQDGRRHGDLGDGVEGAEQRDQHEQHDGDRRPPRFDRADVAQPEEQVPAEAAHEPAVQGVATGVGVAVVGDEQLRAE